MKIAAVMSAAIMGLAAAAVVAGAAFSMSPRPHEGAPPPSSDRHACFDPTFVEGFQSLSDNKLLITGAHDQLYELTLGGICMGLDTSFAIGIRSRNGMSQVCGPFDADIVFRDMGGMRHLQACPITQVRHLTGDEAAKYLAAPKRKTVRGNRNATG